ncbi:ABC transporter permease [Sphingomonas hengshuiensis]|uniref:ABC transporter permease n=1 Tax=Sphingomonas hengshuiensis TaxID=1609977 RepID=A0A7U5CUH7_9SPHN|nr:ABC transporter permease subunit [Sphingomonas hengshuiensis]AJP70666.1 ABC transporter permease [Sphingomonas hengshuiensis]
MKALLSRCWGRAAIGLVAPVLFLVWWQSQALSGGAHALAFAPLESIGAGFVELAVQGTLVADMASTLSRSLSGLAIGGTLGIALGVAMAIFRPLDRALNPLLQAIRQVPLMGWLPLLGLWVGTGRGTELIVVSLSAFFPTLLNSFEGVAGVERRFVEVGQIYGFTPAQRFRLILLPAAMPLILTGLTQGLAFAWIASIASEILLGVGGGLGVTMQLAQTQQRLDIILVAILVTAALGFAINQVFLRLRRHLLRWQPPLR